MYYVFHITSQLDLETANPISKNLSNIIISEDLTGSRKTKGIISGSFMYLFSNRKIAREFISLASPFYLQVNVL